MMLPSPAKVLNTFIYKLCGGVNPDGATLLQHIAASMKIALGGYVVGVIIGVPLGIAMAWNRKFEMFAKPLFDIIRPIPALAWIPLMILWLGIGYWSKVGIIFFAAFISATINSYAGIKRTSQVHLWVASTFGATNMQMLFKVAIPTALPMIFTGLRLALGSSWVALVAAELLAATRCYHRWHDHHRSGRLSAFYHSGMASNKICKRRKKVNGTKKVCFSFY